MKIAAIGLLCVAASAQTLGPELASALNFENGASQGWLAGPAAKLNGEIVHSGKRAVRITRTASDTGGFSEILRQLPMEFNGSRIEMRGFI